MTPTHTHECAPRKLTPGGFIRERQLRPHIIPVAHSTLWRWVKALSFPAPHSLGPKVTAWKTDDVIAWIARQGGEK